MYKTIKIGRIKTSKTELIDITKAWLALSLAFAFIYSGVNLFRGNVLDVFSTQFLLMFIISLFTAGLGFLLHELAHKFVAQKFGCVAEFRAMDQMLYLAVGLAIFVGFIFAAPGAVMISGMITRRENGLISLAGPAINFVLGIIFLGFLISIIGTFSGAMSVVDLVRHGMRDLPLIYLAPAIGFFINMWLGLFNLIPFGPLDGKKIFYWNKTVWGVMAAVGVLFLFVL